MAPRSRDCARRASNGSTATIVSAPAIRAPWTTNYRLRPRRSRAPMTQARRGRHSRRHRLPSARRNRAAPRCRARSRPEAAERPPGHQDELGGAPIVVIRYTVSFPTRSRVVPSGIVPLPIASRSGTHAVRLPLRQAAHSPHAGAHESTTRSPGATLATPLPTASTIPEPSCPRIIGVGRGHSPRTTWRSRAADPDRRHAHHDIARSGLVQLDLGDPERCCRARESAARVLTSSPPPSRWLVGKCGAGGGG